MWGVTAVTNDMTEFPGRMFVALRSSDVGVLINIKC